MFLSVSYKIVIDIITIENIFVGLIRSCIKQAWILALMLASYLFLYIYLFFLHLFCYRMREQFIRTIFSMWKMWYMFGFIIICIYMSAIFLYLLVYFYFQTGNCCYDICELWWRKILFLQTRSLEWPYCCWFGLPMVRVQIKIWLVWLPLKQY